jgi:acyl-coenzyme A synthetase/AMP-(fatty) acid ligase
MAFNEAAEKNVRQINMAGKVFFKTSGSTSEPKMALHANANLTQNAQNCVERFRLHAQDRVLIAVPVYHMYGFGAGFLPGVMAGASIRLIDQTDIIKLLGHEKQFRPNVSYLTPTLIEMALRTRKSTYPYRLIVTAGDRINQASYVHFENKFGQLVNLYGSTELGAIATSCLDEPPETRSNSIVHVMPGVDVQLENEMAEIMCRHDSGFDAYVDKEGKWIPGKTSGWFMTKDLGRIVSPGVFKVAGRTGNSINRNGILVSFMEVESLLEPGIAEIEHVVVTARQEETIRGKTLVACCQLKPGTTIDTSEIRSRCFAVMPRHMVPDEVLVIKEIPRLPNGKFDRKKITDTLNLKN